MLLLFTTNSVTGRALVWHFLSQYKNLPTKPVPQSTRELTAFVTHSHVRDAAMPSAHRTAPGGAAALGTASVSRWCQPTKGWA